MPIAQWTDELKTGVTEIDSQHKDLIRLVNDLHESLSTGKGKEFASEAIRFLSNYVVEHFQNEENLMTKHNYPGYPKHKREHESFIHDFTTLTVEFNKTGNTSFLAITLQNSIVQWLVNHIMKVDKDLASFINSDDSNRVA